MINHADISLESHEFETRHKLRPNKWTILPLSGDHRYSLNKLKALYPRYEFRYSCPLRRITHEQH